MRDLQAAAAMKLTVRGVDYAWGAVPFDALRGHGVRFVMRYLSHDPSKDIDPVELRELWRRGILVGVVWETTAGRALQGFAAGRLDAIAADRLGQARGLPGIMHRFAVDRDVEPAQVAPYFRGARSVLGRRRNSVYGSYRVVKWLVEQGICSSPWQTYAWSGGAVYGGAGVLQFRNGVNIAGLSCDLDRASRAGLATMRGPQDTAAQRQRARLLKSLALLREAARYHRGPNVARAIRYLTRRTRA